MKVSFKRIIQEFLRGKSARNFKLDCYKKGAKNRSLTWNLTDEQFDKLTSSYCNYCGAPPSNVARNNYGKGDFTYNGIDRVDNTRGYEPDNVVACCRICNRAKDTMSQKDFIAWARRVVTNNP